jgi:hypothetical protein
VVADPGGDHDVTTVFSVPRQRTVKILLSLLSEKAIKKDGRLENLFSVVYSTQEPQFDNLAVFIIKEYSQ